MRGRGWDRVFSEPDSRDRCPTGTHGPSLKAADNKEELWIKCLMETPLLDLGLFFLPVTASECLSPAATLTTAAFRL